MPTRRRLLSANARFLGPRDGMVSQTTLMICDQAQGSASVIRMAPDTFFKKCNRPVPWHDRIDRERITTVRRIRRARIANQHLHADFFLSFYDFAPCLECARANWKSRPHELDAAPQAGVCHRHRDLPRAPAKRAWRFARSARSLARVPISACGGKLRVIACIEDPPLIAKILGHVQRREALTSAPRGPPASQSLPNVT